MIRVCSLLFAVAAMVSWQVGAWAQGRGATGGFGVVDLKRVVDEYEQRKVLEGQLQQIRDQMRAKLQWRANNLLLEEAEIAEYEQLSSITNPTDQQRQRLQQIEQKSQQLNRELSELRQKNPPSEQEVQRINQLTAIENRNKEALLQRQEQFEQELNTRREEMINQMLQEIRKAVAAIAQEKGLSVVFDSAMVLYAANDITSDVIRRLNRK
ncbi:MAG: OmpH family outer membrane protein [Armatimonadota bacterium]|nr:OmpH family outer membrane protein [bacterium]MCS7309191.1 OmpH family outer membrane protein [Armatimonadota bacterium]MDW8103380.1 OmpH family outer membrane protein [Armatimonadota bacterium]MDW8289242.1 OmpH family outer membrane protein [Armatimonadota bacterium]